jgi:hypothetical protein
MNTSLNHGSAKIYQFPVGGRSALNSHRQAAQASTELAAVRGAKGVTTSGWYHEAAVQEAEQTREH